MKISNRTIFLILLEIILVTISVAYYDYSFLVIGGLLVLTFLGIDRRINIILLLILMSSGETLPGFSLGSFSVSVMHIIILISFLYLFVDIAFQGEVDLTNLKNVFFYLIIAFLFICILSIASATNKVESIRYIRDVIFWTLLAIYFVLYISSTKDIQRVIHYWIYLALVVSTIGILQLFFRFNPFLLSENYVPQNVGYFRINSTFRDPNFLANFLIMPIMILTTQIFMSRQRGQIWILAILLITLLLTGSRGGILAVLLGVFMVYIMKHWGKRLTLRMILFAIYSFAVLFALVFILPDYLYERFLITSHDADWSNIYRILYVLIAIKVIASRPLLGVGINNFPLVIKDYASPLAYDYLTLGTGKIVHGGGYAHNTLLQIWAETGILGAVVMVILVLLVLRLTVKVRKSERIRENDRALFLGILLGFLALSVHHLTITHLAYHTFLTIGLIISISNFYNVIHGKYERKQNIKALKDE